MSIVIFSAQFKFPAFYWRDTLSLKGIKPIVIFFFRLCAKVKQSAEFKLAGEKVQNINKERKENLSEFSKISRNDWVWTVLWEVCVTENLHNIIDIPKRKSVVNKM